MALFNPDLCTLLLLYCPAGGRGDADSLGHLAHDFPLTRRVLHQCSQANSCEQAATVVAEVAASARLASIWHGE